MRDHVILNPQKDSGALEVHLRVVKFKDLEPDVAALNHAGEIGKELILDAFFLENDNFPGPPS